MFESEAPLHSKLAFTLQDVAKLTGFSRQTIARMFENEPGVIVVKHPEKMHTRGSRSIRIPRAVYERVLRRISN